MHAARSVHRPRSHTSQSRPLASPSVRPTQLCLRTSLICVFHYAQGKVHSGPGCGSRPHLLPPTCSLPSGLAALSTRRLSAAEPSWLCPRLCRGVWSHAPSWEGLRGCRSARGRRPLWDMRTRSSGTHPPPPLLLLWTEPVQGGPLPPRRHPSFTKAGLRPPVRGSTWRASRARPGPY